VSAAAPAYVSGRVVITGTNAPVARASVAVYALGGVTAGETAHTLLNGSFVVKLAQPGNYGVEVESDSSQPYHANLTVPAAGLTGLTFVVKPVPTLHLKLIGPDGEPLRGGSVDTWMDIHSYVAERPFVRGARPGTPEPRNVSPDGTVDIPMPPTVDAEHTSQITVGVREAQIGWGQTHIDGWTEDPLTVYLQKGAVLSGKVLGDDGKPIPGSQIIAVRASNPEEGYRQLFIGPLGETALRAAAVSDEDGKFSIPALPYGPYWIQARFPKGGMGAQMVTLSKSNQQVALSARDDAFGGAAPFGVLPRQGIPPGGPAWPLPFGFRRGPLVPPVNPNPRGFGQVPMIPQVPGAPQFPPIPRLFPGPRRDPMPQEAPRAPKPQAGGGGVLHLI